MTEIFEIFKSPPKLTLLKYEDHNIRYHHFGVLDETTGFKGFGGDKDISLAQTKALYELIERTVFNTVADGESSSGWSAHSNIDDAKLNAMLELLERDAVLCSWLLRISPKIVKSVYFSQFNQEFKILQFGADKTFFILGVILEVGGNRMLLSTSSSTIEACIEKLLIDSERAFNLLTEKDSVSDEILSRHHNNFCSMKSADLSWLYADGKGIVSPEIDFEFRSFKVPLWNSEVAWVVKAKSALLQKLYYSNNSSDLNFKRLNELSQSSNIEINQSLHPIL